MVRLPDEAKEVARYLLSHYWIHKYANKDLYAIAKKHYEVLHHFFTSIELNLVRPLNPEGIIKIDKMPVIPQASHGISSFIRPLDYVIFCAFLAFMEDVNVSFFVFPKIVDDIARYMPKDGAAMPNGFDTSQHDTRLSVVRVFKYLLKQGIIMRKDADDIEQYADNAQYEGLYWTQVGHQHVLRNFLTGTLIRFASKEEFIRAEVDDMANINDRDFPDHARAVRHLLTLPYVREDDLDNSTWNLLDDLNNDASSKLQEAIASIEENLGLEFERYHKGAAFVASEYVRNLSLFFDSQRDTMAELTLLFATLVKEKVIRHKLNPNRAGLIETPIGDFASLLNELYDKHHLKWASAIRDNWHKKLDRLTSTSRQLVEFLIEWRMVEIVQRDDKDWAILHPFLVRNTGEYNLREGTSDE